ncbi:MAG: response regulator [Spirochaetes bacterium]|nr:response regulator [Spirochaetota bacterium]
MKKRILIVEDEAIICMHIIDTLTRLGYDVPPAVSSAKEALDRARELRPDLILLDIVISGDSDGVEAAKVIRDTLGIPVVYLTGNADIATVNRARETNPYGYVLKPVNPMDLFSTIDTAIHRHELELRLRESEEKYRLITEMMSDVIWTLDMNLKFTYISPSIEKVLGFTPEEQMAKDIKEMMRSDSFNAIIKKFQEELTREAEGRSDPDRRIVVMVEAFRKDGSTVVLETVVKAIRGPDGSVIGMHGASRDISERG